MADIKLHPNVATPLIRLRIALYESSVAETARAVADAPATARPPRVPPLPLRRHHIAHPAHRRNSEWTDRYIGKVRNAATANHKVDQTCQQHNITHKLTPIRRPQTAGGAERCNRRFSEAMARLPKYNTGKSYGRNCFRNHDERNAFVLNFTRNYNHTKRTLNRRGKCYVQCNKTAKSKETITQIITLIKGAGGYSGHARCCYKYCIKA